MPASPPRPCTTATRPSTTRPTWCCAWRGTRTRSGCAGSPGRFCPKRRGPSPRRTTAPRSRRGPSRAWWRNVWRCPAPSSSWAARGMPRSGGRRACASRCWASWPVRCCWATPPPCMPASIRRGSSTGISATDMTASPAAPFWRREASPGTRRPSGPLWRRRPEGLKQREWTRGCGTG